MSYPTEGEIIIDRKAPPGKGGAGKEMTCGYLRIFEWKVTPKIRPEWTDAILAAAKAAVA